VEEVLVRGARGSQVVFVDVVPLDSEWDDEAARHLGLCMSFRTKDAASMEHEEVIELPGRCVRMCRWRWCGGSLLSPS
jgi:hypothetical protein